ncbi:MAG: tetratricopeptide repeat protein [Gallionella sp.]
MIKTEHTLFDRANEEWDAGRLQVAFDLFMEAAKSGDVWAFNSLGYFYDQGISVERNPKRAMEWYRKSAKSGDACGCLNLATQYRDAGNIRCAKKWYIRAIEGGDADAALQLGKLYLSGKSLKLAAKYLQIAKSSTFIDDDGKQEAEMLFLSLPREK